MLKLNVIKEKGIVLKEFVTIINESLKIILNRHLIKNNLNQKVFFFCYYLYFTLQIINYCQIEVVISCFFFFFIIYY
jgi:hypothetical protein